MHQLVLVSAFFTFLFSFLQAVCQLCSRIWIAPNTSGLLHALAAMNPNKSAAGPGDIGGDEEEAVSVTSRRLCEWKQPRKQKSLRMTEASFKKHVYV